MIGMWVVFHVESIVPSWLVIFTLVPQQSRPSFAPKPTSQYVFFEPTILYKDPEFTCSQNLRLVRNSGCFTHDNNEQMTILSVPATPTTQVGERRRASTLSQEVVSELHIHDPYIHSIYTMRAQREAAQNYAYLHTP